MSHQNEAMMNSSPETIAVFMQSARKYALLSIVGFDVMADLFDGVKYVMSGDIVAVRR
jgi:hypothetical protein